MAATGDTKDHSDSRTEGFWFTSMTPGETKTFWGCFAGWALDAFDVQLYSLVIPALFTLGFISIGYLGSLISLGAAIAIFAGSAYALMAIATLRLPETRGLELESEALGA